MDDRHSELVKALMLLLLLITLASCGGDLALPEPARLKPQRERDDWIEPGKEVDLKGVAFEMASDRMRVRNTETFDLTLLDDIWLTLSARNAEVEQGRDRWYVHLRCPTSRIIPSGTEVEIPYHTCSITTYEPGPGARVIGFRLVAREGYRETHVEGGPEIVRRPK